MKNEVVEFYGEQLLTAKSDEGVEFVAMKPLCENLGLDWSAQRQRLLRDEVLKQGMVIITTPADNGGLGGAQKTVFIPTEYLNGWLFGVDVSRLKDEATKAKIIVYKKECYKVLHKHWNKKSGSPNERLDRVESIVSMMSESLKLLSESVKILAENLNRPTNISQFVTINPQLTDNKRRKEEFIRCVIDILSNFDEGISQTALFHRLEFSQSGQTRRWLHEGVGTWWDMYQIPGNGYRYISKPEIAEINS
ncbi:MAG: hypothetical protein NTW78_05860 [Campylobacterales bacterium]|nr:hypothetical protein [Campylobacterales bacterium]